MLTQTLQRILPNASFYIDALPLLILLGTGILTMIVGVFSAPDKPNKTTFRIATVALVVAAICARAPMHMPGVFWSGRVVLDDVAHISFFIITIGTLFTLLCASTTTLGQKFLRSELTTLLLFSSAGLMIMAMSGELLTFFIGLEIVSLCLYVLVEYLESSIKYFLLGSAASAVILMGAALVYASLGSLHFTDFYALNFSNPFSLFGIFLIIAGLAFKLGIAPFHAWVPDVYQGASSHLTGYMASMVKFSLIVTLMRVLSSFSSGSNGLLWFFCIIGVISIVIGSLFGLVHNSVKRMLAYSSVANVGYLCIAFAGIVKNPYSVSAKQGLFIYAVIYALLSIGAFNVLAWFENNNRKDVLKEELAGIGQKHPLPAFALSVFLFGLAGIPPLAGFFGKLMLIISAVQNGLVWFAVVLVLMSCFALYYYLNLMVEMWFKAPTRYTLTVQNGKNARVLMSVMTVFALIGVAGIGLFGV